MTGRDAVTAVARGAVGVVDREDAARGLLLEPLADVALVRSDLVGELVRPERAVLGEGLIEVEPLAEVHGEQIPRTEGCLEEARHERVAALLRLLRWGSECFSHHISSRS